MPPGRIPREVFEAFPIGKILLGGGQDTLERLPVLSGLGTPWEFPEEVRGNGRGEKSLGIFGAPAIYPQIRGKKMDGWMDGCLC